MMCRMLLAASMVFLGSLPIAAMADTTTTAETTAEFIRNCDVPVPGSECIFEFQMAVRTNVEFGKGAERNICLPSD